VRALLRPRERALALAVVVAAGVAVFVLASTVFEFHSSNHDEGVYLQQAELLLDGRFVLDPAGYGEAVRPWFFFESDAGFVPKYQPLPAGLYAVAIALFSEPRVALAAVAAGNAALVYVLGAQVFDRRVGALAAAGFAFAPMTLASSSVFLAYAPTTLCNLAFAAAYLRAVREKRAGYGALAGLAIGVAFFMRPFTAVLFAVPFLAHALFELAASLRDRPTGFPREVPEPFVRQGATAAVGLVFVAAALAYNAVVTGSPLLFPYEAFAPMDGPGFGRRRILSHSIEYTPEVAVGANVHVLWYLVTRWVPAGALGTALAALGLLASWGRIWLVDCDERGRALLAGLFVSVPLGNLFFWGNYNALATWSNPADGLLGQFGPFYHFDLLAPVAVFGAAGALGLWRGRSRLLARLERSRPRLRRPTRVLSVVVAVALVVSLVGANAALAGAAIERNAAHTGTYEDAYEPFEDREFDDALVFLPTPYGDWLNHPFQYLRNDGDLDGPAVYAMHLGAESDFAAIAADPGRTPYRYSFRGEWTASPENRAVEPKLERLWLREGERLAGETTVGVPDRVTHASVRLEVDGEAERYTIEEFDDEITVEYAFDGDGVAFERPGTETVPIEGPESVVLTIRLVQPAGQTLTYRQEASVRTTDSGVEAIWPPERTVCPLVDDCGYEGTYLPGQRDYPFDGVFFETKLEPAGE
jgi:hypothetical protein